MAEATERSDMTETGDTFRSVSGPKSPRGDRGKKKVRVEIEKAENGPFVVKCFKESVEGGIGSIAAPKTYSFNTSAEVSKYLDQEFGVAGGAPGAEGGAPAPAGPPRPMRPAPAGPRPMPPPPRAAAPPPNPGPENEY